MSAILHNAVLFQTIGRYLDHESKSSLRLVNPTCSDIHLLATRKLHLNYVESSFVQKFGHLTSIDCSYTRVTNGIIAKFPPSLEVLNINRCEYVNRNLNLSQFKRLRKFACQYTNVGDSTLRSLSASLEELDVSFVETFKNPDFSGFPVLKTLYMLHCPGINVKGLNISRLPSLREICCQTSRYDVFTVDTVPLSIEVLVTQTQDRLEAKNIDLSHHARLRILECNFKWSVGTANRLPQSLENLKIFRIEEMCEFELSGFRNLNAFCCGESFIRHITTTTIPPSVQVLSLGVFRNVNNYMFDLTGHANLKEFSMYLNSPRALMIVERLPPSLKRLTTLGYHFDVSSFSRFVNLRDLFCFGTHVSSVTSQTFPQSLEVLSLMGCKSIRTDQFDLTGHVHLRDLNCSQTSLTDKELSRLPASLQKLDITECFHMTELELSNYGNLKELICSWTNVKRVTDETIPLSVERLVLSDCQSIDPECFDLSKHSRLRDLDCDNAISLNNRAIKRLPHSLEKLKIAGCCEVSYINLSDYPRLKELDCSWTYVRELTSDLLPPSLEDLKLRGCISVDKTSFDLSKNSRLIRLDCSYTRLNDEAMEKLPTSLRYLNIEETEINLYGYSKYKEFRNTLTKKPHLTGWSFINVPPDVQREWSLTSLREEMFFNGLFLNR